MSQMNAPFDNDSDGTPTPPSAIAWHPSPVLGFIACLVAASLQFVILNLIHPVFPFADLPELGAYPSAELVAQYKAAEYAFQSGNGAVSGGLMGAFIGLFVGLLTARNRLLGAVSGAVAGGLVGGIGGYLAGNLVAAAIYKAREQSLLQSVGFLTLVWGTIAAAVCGAMAAMHNARQIPVAIITGLVVGALAAFLYNIVASLAFPMANLLYVTPKTANERMVWALTFGIVLGIGIACGFRPAKSKQPATGG